MVRYEILIELNDEMKALDTYDVDAIQLNYNIADVIDISSRNSSYSKTITIPETGVNRAIFEDIGDLNADGDFNPNKKTKCWILVDTIVVFKGFLQLRNVIVDLETNKKNYQIVIYADNDNFFKEIGDNMLTDLSWSELNHIWDESNIVNSWTASTDNGYFYPLIDYGYNWNNIGNINGFAGQQVEVRRMYPATNVKYIWDKIFNSVNFDYQSDFLNSDVFKNLYIPFNQKEFNRVDVIETDQLFSVGMTGSTTINTGLVNPPLVQLQNPVVLGTYRIPFTNETQPYGDPNNLYNISLFEYEAPSGFVSQRFVCDFDLTFRHGLQLLGIGLGNTICTIRFKRSKDMNGVDIPPTSNNPTGGRIVPVGGSINTIPLNLSNFTLDFGVNVNVDPVRVRGQIATDILDNTFSVDGRFLKLFPTEKLWVEVTTVGDNAQIRADVGIPVGNITLVNYNIFTANTQNVLFNVLNDEILPDESFPYVSAIPKKFKQKDFITSIIKMFNLYIEPSKEFDKTLIIEPRDEYYSTGQIKDWSKKLDTTQNLDIKILGDTQNNQIILSYKEDSDFYNKDYFERKTAGEIYGQYDEFLENDFVSGVRKIEPEFSPTPLVALNGVGETQSNIILPVIVKENNGTIERTESKPRILTRFYSSTKEPWGYDDFIFFSDSGQPNNAKTMLSTSGFTDVPHDFVVGDVVTITQSDGGSAQPWLNGTFEIVEIPNIYSIVIDKFFVGPGGPPVSGIATPTDGLVGLGAQSANGAFWKWRFEDTDYNLYPYLGHFNHPLKPNYDINFGQTDGLYYQTSLVTNDNLYEVYWKNYIEELTDKSSRIITGNFYLNSEDIADFQFNDTVFVDGQYYKVNKITYDPTKTITSKVELIKSNYNAIKLKQDRVIPPLPNVRNPDGSPSFNPIGPIRPDRRPGNFSSSSTNVIQGTGNVVTGKNNIVANDDNYVAGVDNIVTGKSNIVTGSGNTIESTAEKIFIVGDNNNISDDVVNTIVFGSGLNITESNTLVVDNLEVDGDITTDSSNIIIISDNSEISDLSNALNNTIIGSVNSQINPNSIPIQSNTIIGSVNSEINGGEIGNSIFGGFNNEILYNIFAFGTIPQYSSINGGINNILENSVSSSIIGGFNNDLLISNGSSIIGGSSNEILTSIYSTLVGGLNNLISDSDQSAILGGSSNVMTGGLANSAIIGGNLNIIVAANSSAIIGGVGNTCTGNFSAIIGGENNQLTGTRSVTLGMNNTNYSQSNTVFVSNLVVASSITPSGTGDAQGVTGQITWDADYIYVKTGAGWKRSALSTF